MDSIMSFFGRFHPLLVHLPIGILFLAFLFECLSSGRQYKRLRKAVQPSLALGTVFATFAAVTGFFLRKEGGYEESLADLHQNFGITTAVLAIAVYVLRRKVKFWVATPVERKKVRILLFTPLILLLFLTGHWGGSLTHGEDYLFAAVSLKNNKPADPAEKLKAISNIPDAVLYPEVIQPILEARCYDCHSSTKQKGELRLDRVEFILKGGKHGSVISDGPADSSSLFKRLVLPLEDKHHMPPNEKPQLSSSEIALIKYWIEEKAVFDQPVAQFASKEKITAIIQSLQQARKQSWIPLEAGNPPDEKALRNLKALGITPLPLSDGNPYRMVTFTGSPSISDEQLSGLVKIKHQLVWLNLSHTTLSDEQMEELSKLTNLRVLYLNNTSVTDAGLAQLLALSELRWLSLVGTQVTDKSVPAFLKLPNLTNLFLYQTQVSKAGVKELALGNKQVMVDTGNYMLKQLPTDTVVHKRTYSTN
jgi:uncharacterized membrane protein